MHMRTIVLSILHGVEYSSSMDTVVSYSVCILASSKPQNAYTATSPARPIPLVPPPRSTLTISFYEYMRPQKQSKEGT